MSQNTIAQEFAAEIQVTLPHTASHLAQRLREAQALGRRMRELGLIRRVESALDTETPLRLLAMATRVTSLPAFGGVVYGAAALGVKTVCQGTTIQDSRQTSRVETGDCDYLGLSDRLQWRTYHLAYDLLEEALSAPAGQHPDLILLDLPLFLTRAHMLLGSVDAEEVVEDWERVQTRVTDFWAGPGQALYPFNAGGPQLASLRLRGAGSVFIALRNRGESVIVDPLANGAAQFVATNLHRVRQAGTMRLLNQVIGAGERTVGYSSAGLELDYRTEPTLLLERGVMGFHLRARPCTPLWHIEVPGGVGDWTAERLDGLCQRLIATTYVDHEKALPVALWYATQRVDFPKDVLRFFKQAVQKELGTDEQ